MHPDAVQQSGGKAPHAGPQVNSGQGRARMGPELRLRWLTLLRAVLSCAQFACGGRSRTGKSESQRPQVNSGRGRPEWDLSYGCVGPAAFFERRLWLRLSSGVHGCDWARSFRMVPTCRHPGKPGKKTKRWQAAALLFERTSSKPKKRALCGQSAL